MQANTFVRAGPKSVVLVTLFLAAVRIKGIGVGKLPLVAVGDKARNHDVVAGTKLDTVELRVLLTNAVQIDESVHAQELVDRIGDLAAICLEAVKQR